MEETGEGRTLKPPLQRFPLNSPLAPTSPPLAPFHRKHIRRSSIPDAAVQRLREPAVLARGIRQGASQLLPGSASLASGVRRRLPPQPLPVPAVLPVRLPRHAGRRPLPDALPAPLRALLHLGARPAVPALQTGGSVPGLAAAVPAGAGRAAGLLPAAADLRRPLRPADPAPQLPQPDPRGRGAATRLPA